MEGFKIQQNTNKCHRRSIRLKNYDYSQTGWYFVTICTQNRELFFEDSKIKDIAQTFWLKIPKHFKNVRLDKWITMPNHIHGIIVIENNDNMVEAIHELPLQDMKYRRQMLLPKIIGWYKMNAAKQINLIQGTSGIPFWQRNYYDHIIRNEKSLNNIRQYIINNPDRWSEDIENVKRNPIREQIKRYYDGLFR